MPLVSQTFDQLINFTRTSAATYVNSAGLVALTPASRNLLTFTQEFDNAAWQKSNASITANSVTAPDGTSTADTLVENTASTPHYATQSASYLTGTSYVYSIYAKPSGRNWVAIQVPASIVGSTIKASFDLANGVTGVVNAGLVASISPAGNGWFRCSVQFTATASAAANVLALLANADNSISYTGDGTSGIYLWGAQLEQASAATDYTKNVGGLYPPRFDYDPVTLAPKGLLIEEQRTNLLTYSEQFNGNWTTSRVSISANTAVSPDGTQTADAIVEDTTATNSHAIYRSVTLTAAAHTLSVFTKANGRNWVYLVCTATTNAGAYFNLSNGTVGTVSAGYTASITPVGNGWYRCSISFTATAATWYPNIYLATGDNVTVYTGDGVSGVLTWGAQLEAGAFATSYIPTVASQVTRTADVATINAPNFAPWYNQSEGTFVVEADSAVPTTYTGVGCVASVSNNTDTSFIRVLQYLGRWGGTAQDASVTQANLLQTASYAVNIPAKSAFSYRVNDFAFSASGAAPITDTSGTVPAVERMSIGAGTTAGGASLNGHIRSIRYYPTRLSNAQLQALTA